MTLMVYPFFPKPFIVTYILVTSHPRGLSTMLLPMIYIVIQLIRYDTIYYDSRADPYTYEERRNSLMMSQGWVEDRPAVIPIVTPQLTYASRIIIVKAFLIGTKNNHHI